MIMFFGKKQIFKDLQNTDIWSESCFVKTGSFSTLIRKYSHFGLGSEYTKLNFTVIWPLDVAREC